MKKALTLAEMMIVLTIIGVFCAILLPIARKNTPDQDLAKFKKASNSMLTAIREIVSSDEYYALGDLGIKPDRNLVDDPKYFCKTLAGVLMTKEVNCSNNNLGYNSSAVINLQNVDSDSIEGISVSDYVDCMCKSNTGAGEELVLGDNTILYSVNPYYHFGSKTESGAAQESRLFNLCSKSRRYKILCLDIDGINNGEAPFGYALRTDGVVIPGSRAIAWNKKGIHLSEEEKTISSVDSCPSAALNISPESEICDVDSQKTCPENTLYLEIGTKKMCMMKYNLGDKDFHLPSGIILNSVDNQNVACQYDSMCCWGGQTARSCYNTNGDYSGCNRTVCDYNAAEFGCANLNYGGLSWRLPAADEITYIANNMWIVSISKGNDGLMFCDWYSYPSQSDTCTYGYTADCWRQGMASAQSTSAAPSCMWASGMTHYCQQQENMKSNVLPPAHPEFPLSVRCVAELE